MKEVVIISGKGGTGKTSVASALAFVVLKVVMADCDVDAADLHLILKPVVLDSEDFYSGIKAVIDSEKCSSCGKCKDVCRFNAISREGLRYSVNHLGCEGCGYCYHVCPTMAVDLREQMVGQCFISQTKLNYPMAHAKLGIGADNSGKLVAKVKKDAKLLAEKEGMDYVLVDGSPGIGCPVISSLSGADFVLLVTEPTLSGLSDLKRVWELTRRFRIPGGCVINKADLNPDVTIQTKEFLKENGILLVDELPYDEDFSRAITQGNSLVEYNPGKWRQRFTNIWNMVLKELT